jgi:hypothetical protein
MRLFLVVAPLLLLFPPLIAAQQNDRSDAMQDVQADSRSANGKSPQQKKAVDMQDMPGMDHGQMEGMQKDQHSPMQMSPQTFLEEILGHDTSGTTAQPNSTPSPMLMTKKGAWRLMFHANVFVLDEQQSGPRGGDKFFSTNWFMGMAQRKLGPGTFTARAMLSLEPASVTGRRYPLLFQQGETAFGNPITDGQHPHDFFMELAALYDLKLGEKTLLSFYFAPMGDPAMGPTAYPHRASAFENPVGALGHHQEDSTHIADEVVTVGLTYRTVRIEASGFHGREPDEFRWDIDHGKIDSWSTRLTVQPGKNWSGQYSYGRIKSPEALFPTDDQERMTASIMYNRPLREGNWSNTVLWGRTQSLQDRSIFNSYLLESTLRFRTQNSAWTRLELVDRSNELLLGGNPLPASFVEQPIARVSAYTFGYDRDVHFLPHLATAFGAQFTAYGVADLFKPVYSSHPIGVMLFLRLRPFSGEQK